jgi:hypothetical protein
LLAYVFWHVPRAGAAAREYESGYRAFHDALRAAVTEARQRPHDAIAAMAGDGIAGLFGRRMMLGPTPEFCLHAPGPRELPYPATVLETIRVGSPA